MTSGKRSSLEFVPPPDSYLVSTKASTLVEVDDMKEEIKRIKNEPTFLAKARFWYEYGKISVMSSFFHASTQKRWWRQKRIIERLQNEARRN